MAKRAKKSVIEQDQQPPADPREVFEKHLAIIKAAKLELEEATEAQQAKNAIYRTTLKDAKKAGLDADAIREVLAIQKREPDDVTRSFTNINSYLRWAGIPVGTQLGLFDDGVTVASRVDEDAFERQPISTGAGVSKAKAKGFDAGTDGKNLSDNPHEDGSPEFLSWKAGYDDAQAKLARKLGRNKNGAGAHASA